MKNYCEMASDVLGRIKAYETERRNRRKTIGRRTALLCSLCLVAAIGIGIWQNKLPTAMPTAPTGTEETVGDTKPNANQTVLILDSLSAGETGEFAADMYRPEGYDAPIGSVLALLLEISDNPAQAYSVVFYRYNNGVREPLESLLSDMKTEGELQGTIQVLPVEISHDIAEGYAYFALLNAEQILALAKRGVSCQYVGSGRGTVVSDGWWETAEGIYAFAEHFGDQYVLLREENIQSTPDIFPE